MKIQIDQKEFELMLGYDQIKKRIRLIGVQLSISYEHQNPVFIGVLNGCFMFMGDLMKEVTIPCETAFVRLSSYPDGVRNEQIDELFGLDIDLSGRDVVIVEDIVDSGHSLAHTLRLVHAQRPASVVVCALLYKPRAVQHTFDNLAYVGFEIGNEFVVGYGLDYKRMGRNLRDIYKAV